MKKIPATDPYGKRQKRRYSNKKLKSGRSRKQEIMITKHAGNPCWKC